jgi:hypothetical protein
MYCTVPTITPAAVTAAAAVFAVELVATAGLVALANPKSSSADVRMIVRGNGACFALEAFARVRIGSHVRRQHFDRHCAIKPGVAGLVHLSHAARAAAGQQLIRTHTPPIVQPDGAQNVQHARGGRFEERVVFLGRGQQAVDLPAQRVVPCAGLVEKRPSELGRLWTRPIEEVLCARPVFWAKAHRRVSQVSGDPNPGSVV